jgi:endonuclease/exonuclease/phosphatase family metal-dependent hydrolase
MRVVTWNAQHGVVDPAGPPDLGRALADLGALGGDLVAVQELDRGRERSGRSDQPVAVAAALGGESVWAPALRRGGEYGLALVVRGQVRGATVTRLPGGGEPRVAVLAEVEVDGERCSVAATHLSTRRRTAVAQLVAVLDALAARPAPRVLVGDLNLEPVDLLPWTTSEGYRLANGPPTHSTRADRPRRRIDHVAVQGDVVLGRSLVHRLPASDHLAVSVDLRL